MASIDYENSVYKGRLFCTDFSIEFFCVNPIQGFFSVQTLRTLNHNTHIFYKDTILYIYALISFF